jgi:hypothetical protein
LEARGGVPGEDMFMHAEIKNQSWRTVTAMQAALVMESTYHAQKHHTYFRQVSLTIPTLDVSLTIPTLDR